jgi:hypothetical protein
MTTSVRDLLVSGLRRADDAIGRLYARMAATEIAAALQTGLASDLATAIDRMMIACLPHVTATALARVCEAVRP